MAFYFIQATEKQMFCLGLPLTTIFNKSNLSINQLIETINFPQKKSTILLTNILFNYVIKPN